MILIVGGTSTLGTKVVKLLRDKGHPVRVMTRTPQSRQAESARLLGAEVVVGDLRDRKSLEVACAGATAVVAAAHGFPGNRQNNPRNVDDEGHRALIAEAKRAGVQRFVYVSILGASSDHRVDFFRIKAAIEEEVRRSGMTYSIVRASAFMQSWAVIVGEPLLKSGKTIIFGAGQNPVSFVSADDVATYVIVGLENPKARNRTLEICGPEGYALTQVADLFGAVAGRRGTRKHVPRWFMRLFSRLARPLNPPLSRMMSTGVYMDTADQRFDTSQSLKDFPLKLTRLEDFVRRTYEDGRPTSPARAVPSDRPSA